MPAPRKTLAELELSGAIAKNPSRFENRQDEPAPKGALGKAPRHLTSEEQAIWREIVAQAPEGLLGSCDRLAVEVAVRMVLRMRTQGTSMKASEYSGLINMLGRLGLTPGDRHKLNITSEPAKTTDEDDPWASF